MKESQYGYNQILKNLVKNPPTHPKFRAVHLWEEGKSLRGSGTLILNDQGQHTGVVTASHLFNPKNKAAPIFYQVLQPYSTMMHPIAEAKSVIKEDAVLCIPGNPMPIGGFSPHEGGVWSSERDITPCKVSLPRCTLLATGEKIPVLGHVQEKATGYFYYVLQYHSYPGQSGLGCIKAENELYVFCSGIPIEKEFRKCFGISRSMRRITLAAAVRVDF